MRGILKKRQTLQEGMLESLELANGLVWLEKTLSGNRGQRGEEENSRLLRPMLCARYCGHVSLKVYSNPEVA